MLAKAGERFHVAFAALDFFVENDAIEAFTLIDKLLCEINMSSCDEAEAVEKFLDFQFSVFDAFGNFYFLLAGEQRDLAHLLQIHPNWIVENIEFGIRFFFLFLFFFLLVFVVVVVFFSNFFDAIDV